MIDSKKVKQDSLDAMWQFLQMGKQKSNVKALADYCRLLQCMMMQKTAGQRQDKPKDQSFDDLDAITNGIVIEAMCLYLSGDLWNEALADVRVNAPTIEAEPVRHGRWIIHIDDIFPSDSTQECSVCHVHETIQIYNDNYCPHCGARMDGDAE